MLATRVQISAAPYFAAPRRRFEIGSEVRAVKLTKFEKARIIGARALQLSMGAPVLLKISEDEMDPMLIAIRELEEGVIPLSVRRGMPQKKELGG